MRHIKSLLKKKEIRTHHQAGLRNKTTVHVWTQIPSQDQTQEKVFANREVPRR